LILSPEEIDQLIARAAPYVGSLVQAIWHTGARLGEITGLTSDRVLSEFGKVIVIDSKKRTARGVTVSDDGAAFFADHAKDKGYGDFVFVNHLGNPWTVQRAGNELRKELERIRFPKPVTYRAIRSSYASFLIAAGVPPAIVARQLGHHSSLTTELYYGHVGETAIETIIRRQLNAADMGTGPVP